jgi:hypothetical protein
MRPRLSAALCPFVLVASLAPVACAPEAAAPTQSKVWSTANSNDGYAACPQDTTVTGGGFEMKDKSIQSGHVPLLVASRPEGNGWRVVCDDATGTHSTECRAYAVCASVLAR